MLQYISQNPEAPLLKSQINCAVQNLQLKKVTFRDPKLMASRCHTPPCHNMFLTDFSNSFTGGKRLCI